MASHENQEHYSKLSGKTHVKISIFSSIPKINNLSVSKRLPENQGIYRIKLLNDLE